MIFALIFIISADFVNGELKLWTTNEETYAAQVATLVTTKYDAIIAATDALKPETDACAVQVNTTADACQTCLTTVVCSTSGSSDANEFLGYMKGVDLLGTGIEVNLVDFANKIAAGAEILYNKYGAPAFTALSSGLESVGEVLQTMGIAIESGLKVAFDVLGTVFTVLFNRFKDEYFGRRRRDTMIEEDLEVRIKRATNSEAKQCLSKCSDCSAFEAGEQEAATRAICGDSLVEEQKMLEASAAKLQAFYTDWESAKDNLIAEQSSVSVKRHRTTETQKRRLLLKWEAGLQDTKDHSKIRQAAEKIGVAENVVKNWIGNQRARLRHSAEPAAKPVKSVQLKGPSAYNLFCSGKHVDGGNPAGSFTSWSEEWKTLPAGEKERLTNEARTTRATINTSCDKEKLRKHHLQQIGCSCDVLKDLGVHIGGYFIDKDGQRPGILGGPKAYSFFQGRAKVQEDFVSHVLEPFT